MESYSNSSAKVPESSGNREDRLQRRRERERARRASETAEQREERLRVRRARDRARRAAQTVEYLHSPQKPHLNCQTPAFASLPSLLFHTSYSTWFRPHHLPRTSRSARACASIAFELTLAPTMLCIHLVLRNSHTTNKSNLENC